MSDLSGRLAELGVWVTRPSAWHGVELAQVREAALRGWTGAALGTWVGEATGAAREALVGALVRQVRRTPAPVWSALLLVATGAWLAPLAARLAVTAPTAEDVDATVVEALLEVAVRGSARRHGRVGTRWLKVQTRRQVIAWLRARGEREGDAPDEPRRRRRAPCGRSRRRARALGWRAGGRR